MSIYGGTSNANAWGKFKDETFLPHDSAGLLSMANSGKDSNSSQVFSNSLLPESTLLTTT